MEMVKNRCCRGVSSTCSCRDQASRSLEIDQEIPNLRILTDANKTATVGRRLKRAGDHFNILLHYDSISRDALRQLIQQLCLNESCRSSIFDDSTDADTDH